MYDTSPNTRFVYLRKIPSDSLKGGASPLQNAEDATGYWVQLSARHDLGSTIKGSKVVSSILTFQFDQRHFKEIKHIVIHPSTVQITQGFASSGVGRSG